MYRETILPEEDEEVVPPAPRVNRFYPPRRGLRAQLHEQGRWLMVVPNRADRRRSGERGRGTTERTR